MASLHEMWIYLRRQYSVWRIRLRILYEFYAEEYPEVYWGARFLGTFSGLAFGCGLFGSFVGSVVGFWIGLPFALFTFGLSLLLSVMICSTTGSLIGTFGGVYMAIRLCSAWAETAILYHPRKYERNRRNLVAGCPVPIAGRTFNIVPVSYDIQGPRGKRFAQRSFLLLPEGPQASSLWVIFGGNAMLALDWLPFLTRVLAVETRFDSSPTIAFLLVDYPGYGGNEGRQSERAFLEASCEALRVALSHWEEGSKPAVHMLGHSLGAAAAAQLACNPGSDIQPGRLIMSASFTSIPDMAIEMLYGSFHEPDLAEVVSDARTQGSVEERQGFFPRGRPQGRIRWSSWRGLLADLLLSSFDLGVAAAVRMKPFLRKFVWYVVPDVWDNVEQVQNAVDAGWKVGFVHGAIDRLVPCSMSRELWRAGRSRGENVNVADVGHDDLLLAAPVAYAQLMGLPTGGACAAVAA